MLSSRSLLVPHVKHSRVDISFLLLKVFHEVIIAPFTNPFISGWVFGSFLFFHYYESCGYEYPCTGLCVDTCSFFSGTEIDMELLGHMVTLC